ncbi:MAG: formylmethanofuran dehydrogenase subunit E family protein [Nitrososphaerota archaeon]
MGNEDFLSFAVRLHGHLGPFLVLGLRASLIARRLIGTPSAVEVRVFPKPPLSCVIDGIQAASGCTVGNGKLTVTPSSDKLEVKITFRSDKSAVEVSLPRKLVESLLSKMPAEKSELEKEAIGLLEADEQQLFVVEKVG